jgi:hypothetical protein
VKLCYGLDMDYIDPAAITLKVINGIYSGVTTVELDNLAAETAATMTAKHPGEENFQKIDICFYGINKKTQTGNLSLVFWAKLALVN